MQEIHAPAFDGTVWIGAGPRGSAMCLRRQTRLRNCKPLSRYRRRTRFRHPPAFATQAHPEAQRPNPRAPHAYPQDGLILRMALSIPRRPPKLRQAADPQATDLKHAVNPAYFFPRVEVALLTPSCPQRSPTRGWRRPVGSRTGSVPRELRPLHRSAPSSGTAEAVRHSSYDLSPLRYRQGYFGVRMGAGKTPGDRSLR